MSLNNNKQSALTRKLTVLHQHMINYIVPWQAPNAAFSPHHTHEMCVLVEYGVSDSSIGELIYLGKFCMLCIVMMMIVAIVQSAPGQSVSVSSQDIISLYKLKLTIDQLTFVYRFCYDPVSLKGYSEIP